MSAKEDLLRGDPDPLADQALDPELLGEPLDHRLAKEPERPGERLKRRHQDAIELQEGLLVEDHPVQILRPELARPKAELDGPEREPRVMLDPREAFLLRCGGDDSVLNQCRCGVVEEARDPENVHCASFRTAAGQSPRRGLEHLEAMNARGEPLSGAMGP